MTQLYDEIGVGYRNYRRPAPRIATDRNSKSISAPASRERTSQSPHRYPPADTPRLGCKEALPKVSRVAVLWDPADIPPMTVHS